MKTLSVSLLSFVLILAGCVSHTSRTGMRLEKLDAKAILKLPLDSIQWVERINDTSFIAICHTDSFKSRVVRMTTSGRTEWSILSSMDRGAFLDRVISHVKDGWLYLIYSRYPTGDRGELRMQRIDITSGNASEPTTLVRLSLGDDAGSLKQERRRSHGWSGVVGTAFSPDSTKILAYKSYNVGQDRLGVELTLYRSDLTLIKLN
ncbi:MAG TPA: hypothetical protein VEF04_15870, partial [Blastocatellia bacterium]|nr:hypothetical protein [Blastocatellia bacterium]